MSRQEEDTLMEVYLKVKKKGIRKKFDKQLKKMSTQEKHKWKTPAEKIAQKLTEKCKVDFNQYLKIEGKSTSLCKVKQLHIDKIEYKPVEKKGSNY